MRHSRGRDFSFSRFKIHVFGHKLDTLCATRADPNLAFRALKSVFKIKNLTLYAPLVRTRFSFSRFKIHVFGHKLDTLYSTRTDPFAETMIIQNLYSEENVFFFFLQMQS